MYDDFDDMNWDDNPVMEREEIEEYTSPYQVRCCSCETFFYLGDVYDSLKDMGGYRVQFRCPICNRIRSSAIMEQEDTDV